MTSAEALAYERELEEAVNGNSQLQAPVPQNFRILLYTHLAGIFNLSKTIYPNAPSLLSKK